MALKLIKLVMAGFVLSLVFSKNLYAQDSGYKISIISYQHNYVDNHEVVGKDDRKYISFYPINKSYLINASFKRIIDTKGFEMSTASGKKQKYFKYGLLTFRVQDSAMHLYVYQAQDLMQQPKYKDYLFVPFGDATSGFTSYGGGRYLDFTIDDIKNNHLLIDFNKAYNPYCAYTAGYDCPLPPKENLLTVAIYAGEKNYGKPVH